MYTIKPKNVTKLKNLTTFFPKKFSPVLIGIQCKWYTMQILLSDRILYWPKKFLQEISSLMDAARSTRTNPDFFSCVVALIAVVVVAVVVVYYYN